MLAHCNLLLQNSEARRDRGQQYTPASGRRGPGGHGGGLRARPNGLCPFAGTGGLLRGAAESLRGEGKDPHDFWWCGCDIDPGRRRGSRGQRSHLGSRDAGGTCIRRELPRFGKCCQSSDRGHRPTSTYRIWALGERVCPDHPWEMKRPGHAFGPRTSNVASMRLNPQTKPSTRQREIKVPAMSLGRRFNFPRTPCLPDRLIYGHRL
jgi:hypothetical protein